MPKPRILLTRRWPAVVERELAASFDVVTNEGDRALDATELAAALDECDALCATVTDCLDRTLLVPGRRARLVANYGVGYSHIDVEAAKRAGIAVTNTPDVLTDCTADLALTLLLMVARRAGEGEREVRGGRWTGWRPTHLLGRRVSGRTLGLVGFGRIARAVAQRAHHGFGMDVLFHTPRPPPPETAARYGARACASLDALLGEVDFLSIHCPGGAATRHLLDATRLALLAPHAVLVNTARGEVVDQAALVAALEAGRLGGAGLDVYEGEPAVPAALTGREDVVLLPHLGSATLETRAAMGRRVMRNLEAFFSGKAPPDRVA